jgi:inhibitor of KinA
MGSVLLNKLTYTQFGEQAILIEWKSILDETILADILDFKRKIVSEQNIDFLDIIQGYNSLTILYKNEIFDFKREVDFLKSVYISTLKKGEQKFYQWEIPVCYDLKFGIDLEEISKEKKLTIQKIVELHLEAIYRIYFIGFLPGFLYLGGLNEQLFMDRKSNPRLQVTKGAVGIGGKQTGVYPNNSAGGWNIIGNTPIDFFDIKKENPCFAKAGDAIKFKAISLDEFYLINEEIKENTYQLIKTVYNA